MSAQHLRNMVRVILKAKCFLCRKLCDDQFFNRDASLEIDRLIAENERLRERIAMLKTRYARYRV